MTDNEKQFEDFVRQIKFDDTTDLSHRDKLEQDLLSALTKQTPRQTEIWRTIMKTKIAKLATAAVIILVVALGITLLNKSTTPAWAAEQTIEAFKNVNTVYYVSEHRPGYRTENWARHGSDGKFYMGDFRMQGSGGMILVANARQNVTYQYNEIKKILCIYKGITFTTGSWLDINFYQMLRDEMEDVNITHVKDKRTGKDCVSVTFKVPEKYKGETRSGVILFDVETKLPVRMTSWDNENRDGEPYEETTEIVYNPHIPEEIFEFEIPEGATVIDKRQD